MMMLLQNSARVAALAWGSAHRRSLLTTRHASSSTRRISFLTDVEGDRQYLERFVERSEILQWKPTNSDNPYDWCIDFQYEDDQFVFGGDLWDQGGSDLFCLWQLSSLRERYPKRVHIVLGNRDVNKMRLWTELDVEEFSGVHWNIHAESSSNTKADRLRWILQMTMGSPRAFEYRRSELEQLHGTKVEDADVVQSYQSTCHPETGKLIDYIEHGSLIVRMGQVAFLHGALPLDFVTNQSKQWDDFTTLMPWLEPGQSAMDAGVKTVDDWVVSLNRFASREVSAFREHGMHSLWSSIGGYHHLYGGLIQYGMGFLPGMEPNPTIIYNRWGTITRSEDQQPREFWNHQHTETMREFFRRSKLRLICTGHQPNGDLPNSIQIDVDGETCWIICCDTSYSGDTVLIDTDPNIGRQESLSARGMTAVSEVVIQQSIETGHILNAYCHGTLSNGRQYRSKSLMDPTIIDAGVGCSTQQKSSVSGGIWWVHAGFDDDSLCYSAAKGFEFWRKSA